MLFTILFLSLLAFCSAKTQKECHALNTKFTWRGGGAAAGVVEGNRIIAENIQMGCVFMLYRIGGNEANCVAQRLQNPRSILRKSAAADSGVYPPREDVYARFIELTTAAIKESTLFVDMTPLQWPDVNYIGNKIAPHAARITWFSLVSFWEGERQFKQEMGTHSWVNFLANKTVLIVSMFNITGPKQYSRPDSLAPRFKRLLWVTPPQSLGSTDGRKPEGWTDQRTWIDALEELKRDVSNAGTFDIALLSCGSYGGPLQSHIKALGASSIYLGGSLQILFGIKGNRWINEINERVAAHPEEAGWWVHGDKKERPKYCDNMENCAYHT